jgi:alpha-aminoadipate carrier protein LysW
VREEEMVNCVKCDAAIDVEEDELDEGDVLTCDECGATLNVLSVNPLELEADDAEDEDEDDDDFDDDEDEDDEEEEDWK